MAHLRASSSPSTSRSCLLANFRRPEPSFRVFSIEFIEDVYVASFPSCECECVFVRTLWSTHTFFHVIFSPHDSHPHPMLAQEEVGVWKTRSHQPEKGSRGWKTQNLWHLPSEQIEGKNHHARVLWWIRNLNMKKLLLTVNLLLWWNISNIRFPQHAKSRNASYCLSVEIEWMKWTKIPSPNNLPTQRNNYVSNRHWSRGGKVTRQRIRLRARDSC